MRLSVIVPILNEKDSLRPLCESVRNALSQASFNYELILVDDGSDDGSFDIMTELATEFAWVKVIKFRKNYGQTPAMAAGIDFAQGDVLVTMDGDLQNDPSDILRLVEKIDEGFDLVTGWRHNRQDKLITRKIPSVIANLIIGKVTGLPIRDNGCSLKAYRASLIKRIPLYSEMHRFIPAMSSIAGARVSQLKVKHHARQFGQSKYGLSRIYKVLLDLLVVKTLISFASRPLQWFALLAVPFILISLILIFAAIWQLGMATSTSWVALGGTGLIIGTAAISLIGAGILGELVYHFGDLRLQDFYKITASLHLSDNQRSRPDSDHIVENHLKS